jgi:hypothetical protein
LTTAEGRVIVRPWEINRGRSAWPAPLDRGACAVQIWIMRCPPGTHCNEETGYCDRVPCEGRCREGEICRETAMGERCEPWGEIEMPPTRMGP